MLFVPHPAAAAWRVFFLFCYGSPVTFPWFLVLLCLHVVVLFLSLVLYCLPLPLRGGATLSFFDLLSLFSSFLYFIECVCGICRIQCDDMDLHCLLCVRRNNVVSL